MVAACCEKDGQQQTQEVLAISNLDPTWLHAFPSSWISKNFSKMVEHFQK